MKKIIILPAWHENKLHRPLTEAIICLCSPLCGHMSRLSFAFNTFVLQFLGVFWGSTTKSAFLTVYRISLHAVKTLVILCRVQ